MNFKEINNIIQNSLNILKQEFERNNIKQSKEKNKYACISCNSSNALHLYSDTNTCYCYSCNSNWNVISFVMEVYNLDYINALKYLNQTYSLNLPIKTDTQVKKVESKLNKRFKEYKKLLIEKEIERFRELDNKIYDKIRKVNSGKLDEYLNEEQKENLIKSYDEKLFENSLELEYKKGLIENLTLEFANINEMLEMEVINPKQKAFIEAKLNLLNKSLDTENPNKMELINYFYNLKYNEYINYSKYTPNVIIDINNYISENNKLDMLLNHKKSLLIAPTGSGKTYSILSMFKDMEKLLEKQNKKVCFVVPNATQVQQIQEEYKIKGAWNDANQDLIFIQNTISCYTWDKFGKIEEDLSNTIVILDEIHQIYTDMYRKNKIDKMILNITKCSNRIDITATPNKINFKDYAYILEYKQKLHTNYNVKLYENIDDDKIIDIINNSNGKVSVFRDDIGYLEAISKRTYKKTDTINSNNKDENITYSNIVKSGKLGDIDVVLHTSVIVAGVNIKEPNMSDIILINVKDIATIKQYVARYRGLENVNVHIFNNYKEISKIYSLENRINYELQKVENACNSFNKDRIEGLETIFIEESSIFKGLEKDLSIYKYNGVYKVDEISIRNRIYSSYYTNIDIVSFKNILEEYFNNIEIISNMKNESDEIKDDKKEANKIAKEYLEELEKHSQYLVGYYDIKKNSINTKVKEYLKANKLNKEKIIKYIEDNNLSIMLNNAKVKKKLNSFTKLVTETNYTPHLAYVLNNMHGRTKTIFKEKINVLMFDAIYEKYKDFMELNDINVRLYLFLLDEFPLTISYDDEIIKEKLELLKTKHNIELKEDRLRDYLNYIYIIDTKQIRMGNNGKSVTPINYINNKNINPWVLQNSKIKTHKRVYCPIEYHSLDSICKEYKLNDLDKQCIQKIINNKLDLIKSRKETVIEHLTVFN